MCSFKPSKNISTFPPLLLLGILHFIYNAPLEAERWRFEYIVSSVKHYKKAER